MVKSACGIEAVYMCFNGTGIWGGETMYALIIYTAYNWAWGVRSDYLHSIEV